MEIWYSPHVRPLLASLNRYFSTEINTLLDRHSKPLFGSRTFHLIHRIRLIYIYRLNNRCLNVHSTLPIAIFSFQSTVIVFTCLLHRREVVEGVVAIVEGLFSHYLENSRWKRSNCERYSCTSSNYTIKHQRRPVTSTCFRPGNHK